MYLTNVKRKILIASFLKPVNDIRSFKKMAVSIAKNNRYDVYTTGYPVSLSKDNQNVTLLPLKPFKRNGIGRIRARREVWKIYLKLKPEVIIVNSPDLLVVTVIYKILFGSKIIYDIRENYFRNLWYQSNYIVGIRHILAIAIRTIEVITAPFFNHFLLAEKVYSKQLKFIRHRYTIIENKSLQTDIMKSQKGNGNTLQFLISGTIAREYGVLEGISFYKQVRESFPGSRLMIIGHCANKKTFELLEQHANEDDTIHLNISTVPLPHFEIENAMLQSDVGLLPYLPNRSTDGKWPTKLFEYMAYALPFIIQQSPTWNSFVVGNKEGIVLDFTDDTEFSGSAISELLAVSSNAKKVPGIFWHEEEEKLENVLEQLFVN